MTDIPRDVFDSLEYKLPLIRTILIDDSRNADSPSERT